MMKRISKSKYRITLILSLIFMILLGLVIKNYYDKKINISIGNSEEFSVSELKEAIDETVLYFKEYDPRSSISDVWYDEQASNKVLKTDTRYEKEFKSNPRNVIILYINIYSSVPFLESPTSLTNREDMKVYLVRKSESSDWKVVDKGFG